uniref:MULE domain-containing protein n=1 Tax=Strongyloides venezuelensis TaxID=75913 RepID=A0A0K0FIQ2_STRVS
MSSQESNLKSNHFTVTVQHNHAGNHNKIEKEKILNHIYQEAVENINQPRVLISTNLSDVNKEVSINLPSIADITRTICRKRKNKKNHPTISKHSKAEDLILFDENVTLSNKNSFLFYNAISNTTNNDNNDCETDDEKNDSSKNIENVNDNDSVRKVYGNRILIFATRRTIELLQSMEKISIDGTFRVCPSQFYHMIVEHGYLNSRYLPLAYCLLQNKKKSTYLKVLQTIFRNGNKVRFVTSDYEKRLLNSVLTNFSENVKLNGCYFHFGQSVWRAIQKYSHAGVYNANTKSALIMRLFLVIPFVPLSSIKNALNEVSKIMKKKIPNSKEFIEYYKNTLIGTKTKNLLFGLKLWNKYKYILDHNLNITKNYAESFNSVFGRMVNENNATIFKLIECLKLQESLTNNEINKQLLGEVSEAFSKKNLKSKITAQKKFLANFTKIVFLIS